jgi:hypothetical protein
MKRNLLCVLSCLFICMAYAQNTSRHISFRSIEKDSVMLPLNDKYYLIEDSCAQIIRYCRFNFQEKKFFGKFKDVSKVNPGLIVAEGTYTNDGLKNGSFTTHYLNGNLQSRGSFKDDTYDGKWEMYYDDGKPELTFEVINGDFIINAAWNSDGTKTVDNGNGIYTDSMDAWYWVGKLVEGKPEGKWKLIKTNDFTELATEHFKKGKFIEGERGDYSYTDASHIRLVSPYKLPFVYAEKMYTSLVACDADDIRLNPNPVINLKHIVNAHYKDGFKTFSSYIDDVVSLYLSRHHLTNINYTIEINGEVAENGGIINLKNNESNGQDIARGVMIQLRNLPALIPAVVDGKPVVQKFTIIFKFYKGMYEFTYSFLPIGY